METLPNGYILDIPAGAFPLSTDSVLLADFVRLPKKAAVLDLGSGCGTLGLYLCSKDESCSVTGIELSEASHQAALSNIDANRLNSRMESICTDLRRISEVIKPGTFDVCLSNPPYFSGGPTSKAVPQARREDTCSTQALFAAAGYALRYGGDFFLVHRPERLAELCAQASAVKLEPKRLRLIRHKAGGPVTLILLQCRKGGRPGLVWEESSLFDESGSPTAQYKKLYHL